MRRADREACDHLHAEGRILELSQARARTKNRRLARRSRAESDPWLALAKDDVLDRQKWSAIHPPDPQSTRDFQRQGRSVRSRRRARERLHVWTSRIGYRANEGCGFRNVPNRA